jgi:hypothetical protein
MAFVDLWRGILFCDILRVEDEAARRTKGDPIPLLRYVAVPKPLDDDDDEDELDEGERNITVVGTASSTSSCSLIGDRRMKSSTTVMASLLMATSSMIGWLLHGACLLHVPRHLQTTTVGARIPTSRIPPQVSRFLTAWISRAFQALEKALRVSMYVSLFSACKMMLTSFIPSLCPRKDAILAFR